MVKHQQVHLHVTIAQLAVVYASMIHNQTLVFANPVSLNMDSLTLAVLNAQIPNTLWEELNRVTAATSDVLYV